MNTPNTDREMRFIQRVKEEGRATIQNQYLSDDDQRMLTGLIDRGVVAVEVDALLDLSIFTLKGGN
jgi:hypothetical protein